MSSGVLSIDLYSDHRPVLSAITLWFALIIHGGRWVEFGPHCGDLSPPFLILKVWGGSTGCPRSLGGAGSTGRGLRSGLGVGCSGRWGQREDG